MSERSCGDAVFIRLYAHGILGSGDQALALSLIGLAVHAVHENVTHAYRDHVLTYQQHVRGLKIGYVPGTLRHHFHGSCRFARYFSRNSFVLKRVYISSIAIIMFTHLHAMTCHIEIDMKI